MKKLIAMTIVLVVLTVPSIAGEIPGGGRQDPPPCTTNCSATAPTEGEKETSDETLHIPVEVLELLLTFLTF